MTKTKIAKTENEKELLEALLDIVIQGCSVDKKGNLDSMCLYHYELKLLAEYGKVKIESEYGRRITASII